MPQSGRKVVAWSDEIELGLLRKISAVSGASDAEILLAASVDSLKEFFRWVEMHVKEFSILRLFLVEFCHSVLFFNLFIGGLKILQSMIYHDFISIPWSEKNLLVNLTFYNKIYYFHSSVEAHSSYGIFTSLNSNFYDFRSKLTDSLIFGFRSRKNYYLKSKNPTCRMCPSATIKIINFLINKK